MTDQPFSFTLHGQPATKKNSATLIKGYARLLPSKVYTEYEKECRKQLLALPGTLPHYTRGVKLCARYFLRDKAHWPDLVGLMQATADILSDEYKVAYGRRTLTREWLLADDRIIKGWDGTKIAGLDAKLPRVEITITPLETMLGEELDPFILRQLAAENTLFS